MVDTGSMCSDTPVLTLQTCADAQSGHFAYSDRCFMGLAPDIVSVLSLVAYSTASVLLS